MKIAIDLTALNDNFSGIERYALNMSLSILEQDKEDTFELIFKNEIFPDFQVWKDRDNINMHIIPGCRKLLFNQWRLPNYLNHIKADCYLFFAFPMPVLLRSKKVMGTIHDMGCWDCPDTMKRIMVWYFRLSYLWMAKRAEKIITISEFSKGRIQEKLRVPEDRILLAYCGLSEDFKKKQELSLSDKESIRRKYALPDAYFLCLSTLEPRKNMILLLKTYLSLYKAGKIKTKLVLAGRKGWKISELLVEADAEKDGQVIVTGFIDDRDLPAVYQMAKCFVFPSIYEGFGIPPLEAMSQGVPVISSDSSSLPEVLGDAAVYFRSNDASALEQALLDMEQMENEARERYIRAGIERSRKFLYEVQADVILAATRAASQSDSEI